MPRSAILMVLSLNLITRRNNYLKPVILIDVDIFSNISQISHELIFDRENYIFQPLLNLTF